MSGQIKWLLMALGYRLLDFKQAEGDCWLIDDHS